MSGPGLTDMQDLPASLGTFLPEDFAPAVRGSQAAGASRPSLSYWKDAWIRLRKNRQAVGSLAIVCALVLFTVAGPSLWPVDPSEAVLTRVSEPPRWSNAVVVLPAPPASEEVVVTGADPAPRADGVSLPAPARLETIGEPTVQSVRLAWSHVAGAAGYLVYRSTFRPAGDYLGLPLGEVGAGNIVSFEDTFNLEPTTYWYSVVATNAAESRSVTREVKLAPGISLVMRRQSIRTQTRETSSPTLGDPSGPTTSAVISSPGSWRVRASRSSSVLRRPWLPSYRRLHRRDRGIRGRPGRPLADAHHRLRDRAAVSPLHDPLQGRLRVGPRRERNRADARRDDPSLLDGRRAAHPGPGAAAPRVGVRPGRRGSWARDPATSSCGTCCRIRSA